LSRQNGANLDRRKYPHRRAGARRGCGKIHARWGKFPGEGLTGTGQTDPPRTPEDIMSTLDMQRTVRDFAVGIPGAARIFEQFGIDYCCGGAKSLEEACRDKGVELEAVATSLERLGEGSRLPGIDPASLPLAELANYIVGTHHVYTRHELARIERLLEKVVGVHAEKHPELVEVREIFGGLSHELVSHMMKEERVLFPYIVELSRAVEGKKTTFIPFFESVCNPMRTMVHEHEAAGALLARLRAAANDYDPPEDACVTFKALYAAFEGLERDLSQHVQLENNVLFPRAAMMEVHR
jgi:regulator of cell morphogenesis and NO signaling